VGTFTNGATADVSSLVTWTSTTPAVATVSNSADSQGLVVGVSPGSTPVVARYQGLSTSTGVTVTAAALTALSLSPGGPTIAPMTALQFSATGTFSDGTTQDLGASVGWSSSNLQVATVSSTGLARATGSGTTAIGATLMGMSASTSLTVSTATVASLPVSPPSTQVAAEGPTPLTAQATFSDGTAQDVTAAAVWSTSNPAVAVVSSDGVVTGVGSGTATISATVSGVASSAAVSVP
jgi:hypothetical protein